MWKVYGRDKARDTLARKCVCHQGHEQDHDGGVGAAVGMRRPSQRNRTNRHLISQIPCLRLFIRRMSPLKFSRLRRRSTLGIHDHRCYTTPFHFPMTVVKYSPQTMNRLLKAILRNLFSRNVQIPIRENPFSLSFFYSKRFTPFTSTALVRKKNISDRDHAFAYNLSGHFLSSYRL